MHAAVIKKILNATQAIKLFLQASSYLEVVDTYRRLVDGIANEPNVDNRHFCIPE